MPLTAVMFSAASAVAITTERPASATVSKMQTHNIIGNFEESIARLDDLLKPVDWISNSQKASKIFNETLKDIGRFLNLITGQRGYIKSMSEVGQVLTGAAKSANVLSNLLAVRDYNNYFSGNSTNQQMADQAIHAIIPIPILNSRISSWLVTNMPDPNGKWKGLVTPVQ